MKTVAREFLEKFEGVLKLNEGYTEGNVEQMIPEREALELQQIQAKNMLSAKVIYRYEDGGLANKFKALEPDVKDYWGSPVMPGFCEIKTINLMGQQAVAFIHNTLTDDYFMVSPSKEALEMAVAGKTAPDAPARSPPVAPRAARRSGRRVLPVRCALHPGDRGRPKSCPGCSCRRRFHPSRHGRSRRPPRS